MHGCFAVVYGNIQLCGVCCVVVGEVVEEWMPVDVSSELYRIDYKPFECNHPKVVVDRARSRLNECK